MMNKITISLENGQVISIDSLSQKDKSTEANAGGSFLRYLSTFGNPLTNAIVTLCNKLVSLGTYDSINDIKSSNKVINAIEKYKKSSTTVLSMDEIKTSLKNDIFVDVGYGDEKAEQKRANIYALCWLLGIGLFKTHSGDKLKDLDFKYRITTIEGVPVLIAKLSFGRNTMDASGLVGQALCVLCTFYKDSNGKLKTSRVGKCYLTKNGKKELNGSVESFSIIPTSSGILIEDDDF